MTKLKFNEVFKNKKVFLPVIHCISENQVQEQYRIAKSNGADGVFLIDQGGLPVDKILDLLDFFCKEDEEFFCGINLLENSSLEWNIRFHKLHKELLGIKTNGIWIDNCGINLNDFNQSAHNANSLLNFRQLIFGGIAFKYQPEVSPFDWEYVGHLAKHYKIDVPTTSGDKTGEPPSLNKIDDIKNSIGNLPLAIASGIDSENVKRYLPYVDAFIVASSIEKYFGHFDDVEVSRLEKIIHS